MTRTTLVSKTIDATRQMGQRLRATITGPAMWLSRAIMIPGWERHLLLQITKMVLAAVVAWSVAEQLHSPQSFIGPYTAVFVISQTAYRSILQVARQVAAVVMGVLVAFLATFALPGAIIPLAVAVLVGMLIGQWQRLGDNGMWVGIIALLMVTSGTADNLSYLFYRVLEVLAGVVVGATINLVLLPPIGVRHADRVIRDAAKRLSELTDTVGAQLAQSWDNTQAQEWLRLARGVDDSIFRAEAAVIHGWESTRFNLRWRLRRGRKVRAPDELRNTIDTLKAVSDELRRTVSTLESLSRSTGEINFDADLSAVLNPLAAAISTYQQPAHPMSSAISEGRAALEHLKEQHYSVPLAARNAHGALVFALDNAFSKLEGDATSS